MIAVWRYSRAVLVLTLLLATGSDLAKSQNPTTFRVNMNIKALKNVFAIGADTVWIRGDFNGWAGLTDSARLVRNSGSDSIYKVTMTLPAGAVNYKFFFNHNAAGTWEGDPNRTYTVTAGTQTVPLVYFDRDSIFTAAPKVPVKFQVNMRAAILSGIFVRDSDYVRISGTLNGWSTTADTMKRNAGDSIYTRTDSLDPNSVVTYKFLKTLRINSDYESIANRTFTVPVGGGIIPVAYFNNDSLVHTAATGTIKWQVNMAAMKTLGWFDPTKDTMQVRGGFEGWGGTKITQDLFNTNVYNKTIAFGELIGNNMAYKFYMKHDSAHAFSLWGTDWNANTRDSYDYEHPAPLGDGNNQFLVTGSGALATSATYFSSIPPSGLLGATDSVNVTFKVKMGPATKYSNPLNLATDTVKFVLYDRIWRAAMWKNEHLAAIPDAFKMTGPNMTDSSYTVTIQVKGPTHYNMLYFYRVNKSDASSYDEGGGLGVGNPERARFIGKNGSAWPASYTAPTDVWQKDAPLPGEASPFSTGIVPAGVPLVYSLNQNYPNPFNPATTISYTLPAQSAVTLKVFNVLGQQVETLVNTVQSVGNHIVVFDASRLSSGVYFYRLEAGKFTQVMKMMLLK